MAGPSTARPTCVSCLPNSRFGRRIEAIIITSDLADRGDPVAYEELKAIVEPTALRYGAQVIWVSC
jgi:3',5'-cyclic AMP phosphodiesterase CpdA